MCYIAKENTWFCIHERIFASNYMGSITVAGMSICTDVWAKHEMMTLANIHIPLKYKHKESTN